MSYDGGKTLDKRKPLPGNFYLTGLQTVRSLFAANFIPTSLFVVLRRNIFCPFFQCHKKREYFLSDFQVFISRDSSKVAY
jgi:hypothetical protein